MSMSLNTVLSVALTVAVTSLATPPLASFAANDLVPRLADGSQWQITMPNGRRGSLTMMADGTGTISMGPMRMALMWRQSSDGFCMTTQRMGEQCMTLQAVDDGFVLVGQEGNSMQISR